MKVVAVIPAFNEAPRLAEVLAVARPHVDDVVVVDDGSRDATSEVARSAGVRVLRHALNRGQGAALRTGTRAALELGADIIVHLDADGQHDAASIVSVVTAPIRSGQADVVLGSRYLGIAPEGIPRVRRLLHVGIHQFNRWVLGIPASVTDPQAGCRAFTARVGRELTFHQDRMAHASEILRLVTRSSTWRWQEVPIFVRYSAATLEKGQHTGDAFKVAWQLLLGFFHRA